MCELMGLSFEQPISADFSIRAFATRDVENANGWGLAWYPDQSLAIVKEPLEWRQSAYTRFLESYHGLQSRLYIAHVRHMTTGGLPTHADTHPFGRELAGRDFSLAHNGTLPSFRELPLGRFRPVGQTDSEHMFCYLLEQISGREDLLDTMPSWQWLHEQLRALNQRGTLNCLLCDGQRLFCYHDTGGWKGLALCKVLIGANQERHFEDATLEVHMESAPLNQGCAVATRPLSETGWHDFQPGELIVLEGGTIRFSSTDPRMK